MSDVSPVLTILAADRFAANSDLDASDRNRLRLTSLVLANSIGALPAVLFAQRRAEQLAPPPPPLAAGTDDDAVSLDELFEQVARAIDGTSGDEPDGKGDSDTSRRDHHGRFVASKAQDGTAKKDDTAAKDDAGKKDDAAGK